jgi:hypothetical protein
MTRGVINTIISKHKAALANGDIYQEEETFGRYEEQEDDNYYYGILFMDHTVVTIFKNNKQIAVTPADINCLLNFIKTNSDQLRKLQPCFEEICLPGMTEDFKLPVFFKYNEKKVRVKKDNASILDIGGIKSVLNQEPHRTLKLVFVCEDSNPRCLDHLTRISDAIFRDLKSQNLIEFLELSE